MIQACITLNACIFQLCCVACTPHPTPQKKKKTCLAICLLSFTAGVEYIVKDLISLSALKLKVCDGWGSVMDIRDLLLNIVDLSLNMTFNYKIIKKYYFLNKIINE